MSQILQQQEDPDERINQPRLREYIARYFDLSELKELCFDLGVDYDELSGDNKAGKIIALVSYLYRRGRLSELLQKCMQERPGVDWSETEIPADPSPKTLSAHETREAIGKLKELQMILAESWATYLTQNSQRNRLYDMLHSNHPIPPYDGYNELFHKLYDQMNKEEMELFQIIRGTTKGSIFRVNEKLRGWADNNPVYRLLPKSTPSRDRLEEELLQLKIHFNSWFPKYEFVFLKDERQSLVYLDDEHRQGVGFPHHLEEVVEQFIGELEAQID